MAGFSDANTQFLLRTNLWSRQIKELLLDELNAMKFVRIISDLTVHQKRKVALNLTICWKLFRATNAS